MNTAVAMQQGGATAVQVDESELISVLRSSLYPGAKEDSVRLVLGYCKASGLDPMQKPVHIVPMKVKSGRKDDRGYDVYEERDTIMPGIALYRVQAARTGQYAGMSEPEFGPTKTITFQESYWTDEGGKRRKEWREVSVEYPEYCKITVRRIVAGHIAEFPAVEYWTENYATAGRDNNAPNSMWARRPRGQIVKCTEAQALRKAFPEIGAQPTAEEMEGRTAELELPIAEPERIRPAAKADAPAVMIDAETGEVVPKETQEPAADASAVPRGAPAPANVLAFLRRKLGAAGLADDAALAHVGAPSMEALTTEDINVLMKWANGANRAA